MTRSFVGVLALTAVLGLAVGAGAGYITSRPGATPTPQVVAETPAKPGGATIEKVDGTTATVKTGNGSVDVQLANATLQKQEKVAPTDLKVGDNVFGRGEPNAQGVVMLNNVQIVTNLPGRGGQAGADGAAKPSGGSGGNPDQGGRQGGNVQGGGRQGGQGPQGAFQGGGQGAQGGFQGNARGVVAGSIARIDGQTLTITPPNGNAVTATLAEGVQIERIAPAQPADLKTGQTVALQRPPGGNGNTILTIVSG